MSNLKMSKNNIFYNEGLEQKIFMYWMLNHLKIDTENNNEEILKNMAKEFITDVLGEDIVIGSVDLFISCCSIRENKEAYPAVFRIDRISEIKEKHKKYSLPYKDTFKDGEFRKYVHFMHSGELTKIRFKHSGCIEYVLDKFPTSKIVDKENNIYTIEIESYGSYGAEMWLRSQGDFVISYEKLKYKLFMIT